MTSSSPKPRAAKSAPAPRPVKRSPKLAIAGAAIVPQPVEPLTIVSEKAVPVTSATPAAAGKLVTLPIGSIFPSPLNPRRSMSEESLERLGASIIADGQIQPIVVRMMPKIGSSGTQQYEIAAGARRWTSLFRAAERGDIGLDYPIMAVVRELTDSQLVMLAATENLGREDMDAMDEALVFDSLRKVFKAEGIPGRPEEEVARRLGITSRTVFRRLELLKLDEKLQSKVRTKEINLQWAEIIAKTQPQTQRRLLADVESGNIRDLHGLKWNIRSAAIPAKLALFDVALYTGPYDTDEETGEIYFQDAKLFHRLQTEAVKDKAEEFRKSGIPVVLVRNENWRPESYYGEQDGIAQAPKTGALPKGAQRAVALTYGEHSIEVKIYEGLMKLPPGQKPGTAQAKQSAAKPAVIDPVDDVSTGRKVYAKQAKTRVLQDALARSKPGSRVLDEQLCLALMGFTSLLSIKTDDRGADNRVAGPAVSAVLEEFRAKLPGNWEPNRPTLEQTYSFHGRQSETDAALAVLQALDDPSLSLFLRTLLASRCATYVEAYKPLLGDETLPIDVARRLDIDMAEAWQIDMAYLATLKTSQLEDLYYTIGMTAMSKAGGMTPAAFGKLKATEKRQAILDFVVANDIRHVPPELRFDTGNAIESAIRKAAKLDTGASTGEAA